MTMLGVAVVGCGGVGRHHLEALRRCDRARLVATVDVVPDLARRAAVERGARWTTDLNDALNWPHVQAVILCTPSWTHADLAVTAARAGKHLLVEKPLATTVDGANRVLEACRAHGVALMVGHTHRFYGYARAIRAALDGGAVGRPVYLRLLAGGGFWAADWRAWQLDPARSGGHVVHNGVHFMDLANHLLADRPDWVYAQGHRQTSAHLDIHDYFHVTVGYRGGATAACEMSRSAIPRGLNYRVLTLLGSHGEIVMDWDDEAQVLFAEGGVELLGGGVQEGFDRVDAAWVDAVLDGAPPPVTGEEGRLAVVMSVAAERSLATGEVIRLAEVDVHA
ncbi:MAG: Gfo/Idh/MocA family protein [Armatimonadota bacterium]